MNQDKFDRRIHETRKQLSTLVEVATKSTRERDRLVELSEVLSTTLEELHVAQEELREQYDQLAAAREDVESELRRYQELFDHAPDGYLVTDPNGVILEANRTAAGLLGLRPPFAGGKPLMVYVIPRDRRALSQNLAKLNANPAMSIRNLEIWLQPRKAPPFPVSLNASTICDGENNPVGLRWTLRESPAFRKPEDERTREATDPKRAGAGAATERDRELFDSAPDGYLVTDVAGRIRNANPVVCKMVGASERDLLGGSILERLADDDREPVQTLLSGLEAGDDPPHEAWEVILQPVEGEPLPVAFTVAAVRDAAGRCSGLCWLLRDVSERRRRAQERQRLLERVEQERRLARKIADHLRAERDLLEAIMANTDTHLAYLDPRFNFVRVNEAYARGSGYSMEELIGRNHFDLFPNAGNQAIFETVRDTGEPVVFRAKPFEFPGHPERGTTYWDWTLAPVKSTGGEVRGLVFSLVDVTGREGAARDREQYAVRRDTLIRVAQEVLGATTVRAVHQKVVDAALELTGARICSSGHGYRAGGFAIGVASRAEDAPPCPPGESFCIERGGVFLDLLEGKPSLRLTDQQLRTHPRWWGLPDDHAPLRGLLGARLVGRDGKTTGLIMVTDKREGEFTETDEFLLRQLASLASLGLRHIETHDQAEREMREREAVFQAMTEAVLVSNVDGKIIRANPALIKLEGLDPTQIDFPTLIEKLQLRTPAGRRLIPDEAVSRRALRGETVRDERLVFTDVNGEDHLVVCSGAPVRDGDEVVQSVVVVRDITEFERATRQLAASEERFHRAALEAPFPTMIHCEDGDVLLISRSWTELSGYTLEDIPTVAECSRKAFADEAPEFAKAGATLFEQGRRTSHGEFTVTTKDGRKRRWEISSVGLGLLPDGRRAALCASLDLTERREAEDALHELRRRLNGEHSFAGIVGRHPAMLDLFTTIRELAEVEAPVLIQGESGTGKELVANAIHQQGRRAKRPFIVVNCAALPETLLESELFGHVRGAFTGAIRDKKGRFELAHGGTIFLDEIGDLSPTIQVKLLRVLQEKTIEHVGGEKPTHVDVRIISATHKDLNAEVDQGRFREDLFYRLCVVPLRVPPLRERLEDVPLLTDHILRRAKGRVGEDDFSISNEALEAMMGYVWPGNVRELQSALYFAAVKCKSGLIELQHLPPVIWADGSAVALRGAAKGGRRARVTPEQVRRALAEAGGNKTEAAKALGISRITLYRQIPDSKKSPRKKPKRK